MPLIVLVDLPAADVVVVVPDVGRVMVFVDPRVPFSVGADTVALVGGALRQRGDRRLNIARVLNMTPCAMSTGASSVRAARAVG